MNDFREYTFGNWFGIAMRAVPAFLIAQFIWSLILILPAALFWMFLPIGLR